MADIKNIDVIQNVTSVSFQVEPNTNVININKITTTGSTNLAYIPSPTYGVITSDTGSDATILLADGTNAGLISPSEKTKLGATSGTNTGDQNLQSVTNLGATTTIPIIVNSSGDVPVFIGSNIGLGTTGITVLMDNNSNGINLVDYDALGISPLTYISYNPDSGVYTTLTSINEAGQLTATKLIKQGGTSSQLLAANGDSISAGTNITISGGTISSISGVPYTGATSDVNLGEFGIQLGNLEFDNTPTNIPTTAGSVYYNDTDGTLDLILKGGNVKLQVGQESVIRVVNKTATNISLLESNYQAVRVTGAQGQRLKVDLAQATTDGLSAETIGLVTETILNNQEGFITTSGLVRNINTTGSLQSETWVDGDILYLSPTVAGRITNVKPSAPNHLIIIGYVIYSHVNNGSIFVKVDNGYELDELHNVAINGSLANNDLLQYESSTSLWKNKTLSAAGIQATITAGTTSQYFRGDKTFQTLDKTAVGLGNVDDTSDANKPVSTDTQTALNLKANLASPNFTGTVVLPKTTTINTFSPVLIVAKDTVPSSSITGTTSETIFKSYLIPANTYSANDLLKIPLFETTKLGTSAATIKIYTNTTNSLSGAVQIARYAYGVNTILAKILRNFTLNGGQLSGLAFNTSALTDISANTAVNGTTSFNPAVDNYIITTGQLTLSTETFTQTAFQITN